MRSRPHRNVFSPDFLERLSNRDRGGYTCGEAEYAGPWRVVERDGLHCLLHGSEPDDGAAVAEFQERETALLAAAIFPLLGRDTPYGLGDSERHGGRGVDLKAMINGGLEQIGWFRLQHEEIPDLLQVAELFLRSPEALANLLEAAGHEVLDRAGAILAGRLAEREVEG